MTASDDARIVRDGLLTGKRAIATGALPGYRADYFDPAESALDRLVARVEQLEQMHREQEKRANRAEARLRDASLGGDGSHWDGCWRSHIDCAVARVEQAERERDEAREAGNYFIEKRNAVGRRAVAAEARNAALTDALQRAPAMILTVEEYERWYIDCCYPVLAAADRPEGTTP